MTFGKLHYLMKFKEPFFVLLSNSSLSTGSQSWTLTKKLEAKLKGTYTHMLRAVLNIPLKKYPTKQRLYGKLPPISKIITESCTRFAGHSWKCKQELVSDTLPWSPQHGSTFIGRPPCTYIDQLCDETGCLPEDLPNSMRDRDAWRD